MSIEEYKETFISRLAELGLIENTHFKIEKLEGGEFKIEAIENPHFNTLLTAHVIMGMIYHFTSRKWIIDSGYMFIMKTVHYITFNDGSVETV